MRQRCWLICVSAFLALFSWPAQGHIGSPDVFYEGMIGPYPAHVTIRMPTVVPGRAEITVRAESGQPVEVFFRPLYAKSEVANAPPADAGHPIPGETNLYAGDLWLMTLGGYSIEVKIHGAAGEGAVEIPVNSVALRQMPLPRYLGAILIVLGALLFVGGLAIIMGAARDSVLAPGVLPGKTERRKGWIVGTVTLIIFLLVLVFGHRWWKSEERNFRDRLRVGAAPKMSAVARVEGSQRILRLTFANPAYDSSDYLRFLPDHGKLLHFFLIRAGKRDVFAHLHPIRKGGKAFEVTLPPLPAGRYEIFCDLTLEKSGMSLTATNTVEIPAPVAENVSFQPDAKTATSTVTADPDPDDSWDGSLGATEPPFGTATNFTYRLPGGQRVLWKPHAAPRVRQDAGLQFEIQDAAGNPAALEPYMGMMSHAAVLRSDGAVFAHLHPSGNYSMAAQNFYETKMVREAKGSAADSDAMTASMEHTMMMSGQHGSNGSASTISLPYEFPAAGNYRIWVQFKTGSQVLTAVFDTTVVGL